MCLCVYEFFSIDNQERGVIIPKKINLEASDHKKSIREKRGCTPV